MLSISEFRHQLSEVRRGVQRGDPVQVGCRDRLVGVLMPLDDFRRLAPIHTEQVAIAAFRRSLTNYWERMQSADLDGVILTYHSKAIAAFVSPRLLGGSYDRISG